MNANPIEANPTAADQAKGLKRRIADLERATGTYRDAMRSADSPDVALALSVALWERTGTDSDTDLTDGLRSYSEWAKLVSATRTRILRSCYRSGVSQRDIATAVGVSEGYVSQTYGALRISARARDAGVPLTQSEATHAVKHGGARKAESAIRAGLTPDSVIDRRRETAKPAGDAAALDAAVGALTELVAAASYGPDDHETLVSVAAALDALVETVTRAGYATAQGETA